MNSFEELGLDNNILRAIKELKFENPMPVQEKIIPMMLQDEPQDIIALAQTGTGKTAAFGLPIIHKTDTTLRQVQFLVIAPTRELCLQIADDLKDYAIYNKDIKIAAIFGGSSMDRQIQKIKQGAQIISATPGRLNDLIDRGEVNLNKVKAVILDEADEMLNMGFKEELEAILETTPKTRNTFLFSATMPKPLLSIANRYMKDPVEVTIGKRNAGAENVEHVSYMVHARDKYLALKRIVDFHPNVYGIVFCRTRAETKEVSDKLMQDGYNADALHGDLSQSQRESVLNKFRTRHLRLLVATDVAARGLDVDDLTHIINYDLPDELEIYTHRSGRTGRAGKSGTSIVIANLREKYKLNTIEKQLNKKFVNLPIPSGTEICEKQLFHLIDKVEKVEVDTVQVEPFLPKIYEKLEWMDRNDLIQRFVSIEFNRFLEYYKNLQDLSSPSDSKYKERPDNGGGRSSRGGKSGNSNYTRYFLNLGVTDGLKPAQLIGMINDFTGMRDIEIGQIEILKNFSFFEADSNFQNDIMNGFKGQKLKKRDINVEIAEKRRGGGGGGGGSNKPKFSSDRKSSDGYKKSGFSKDRGERSDKKDFGRDRRFSRDKKR
ncbi:MAG: DEAD/DEAH box helicase [Ignavibacteriales bacterium]|nr:DEAD/DEAH box helicase [Ignavibacteriales bacterium]